MGTTWQQTRQVPSLIWQAGTENGDKKWRLSTLGENNIPGCDAVQFDG